MRVIVIIASIFGLTLGATTLHAAQNGQTGNVTAPKPKPKKGIIYIKGKRFTTCTDWGRDKGWCSKNL